MWYESGDEKRNICLPPPPMRGLIQILRSPAPMVVLRSSCVCCRINLWVLFVFLKLRWRSVRIHVHDTKSEISISQPHSAAIKCGSLIPVLPTPNTHTEAPCRNYSEHVCSSCLQDWLLSKSCRSIKYTNNASLSAQYTPDFPWLQIKCCFPFCFALTDSLLNYPLCWIQMY